VSPLTIRWTMGDWPGRRFHPQAYEMLACSVAYARKVFPDAQLVVATNNLTPEGESRVHVTCSAYGAWALPCEEWLPGQVHHGKHVSSTNPNDRNTWWKYAPLRVAPDEHELVLDNDVILWRVPAAVRAWLDDDSTMLLAGDETPTEWTDSNQPYGGYGGFMKENHPSLSLCSNIIGWPPGVTDLPHPLAEAKVRPHYYGNEQGFTAMNWIRWPGPKLLNPWSSVPSVNNHNRRIPAARVLAECDGAHFSDHNVGRTTRFRDEFLPTLGIPAPAGPAPKRGGHPVALGAVTV
jgi:hypothetical protein